MASTPSTWIVGAHDDGDFATRCLLLLEERFALPATVTICHRGRGRAAAGQAGAADRVLAFVPDPPGAGSDFLGLLREGEAAAVLGSPSHGSTAVAVGVARSRDKPVEDAVHLAVTTLLDWGHEIAFRAMTRAA